jgi:hypothetical protein
MPGFFETLGTKIVQGRFIEEQDTATTRPIAVVNESFVRFFKHQNPIGEHFGNINDIVSVILVVNTRLFKKKPEGRHGRVIYHAASFHRSVRLLESCPNGNCQD